MTKANSKPCIACTYYSGGIPCQKNHRPRLFVNGGLRRVCDDFATEPAPAAPSWLDSFMKIFGFRRA